MNNSKAVQSIEKYYELMDNSTPTQDEKLFANNIELTLAESLIYDFGNNKAKKIAKIILAAAE